MIKTLGFVVLWLSGSAAAVAVAWTGVSVVDDRLVVPAPATASTVAGRLASEAQATPDLRAGGRSIAVDGSSGGPGSIEAASSDGRPGEDRQTDTSDDDGPRESTEGGAPPDAANSEASDDLGEERSPPSSPGSPPTTEGGTSSSAPSTSSPATVPTTTATTTPPPTTQGPVEVLTFNLVGGTTQISFSSTVVTVLWATANPGFDVEIEPESSGVKVEFRAEHHRSRIDAWWSNGPRYDIQEEPDD